MMVDCWSQGRHLHCAGVCGTLSYRCLGCEYGLAVHTVWARSCQEQSFILFYYFQDLPYRPEVHNYLMPQKKQRI